MARRIAFLTNPGSGRGAGAWAAQVALARLRASYDVPELVGTSAADALALARRAVTDGFDTLVVCGGDGSVHLGLQAVAGTSTRLAVVPAGTGNDVARYLAIPSDPVRAAQVVLGGRESRIDLGRIESGRIESGGVESGGVGGAPASTWFATVVSCGYDAMVNERANVMTWPRGPARYHRAALAELRRLSPIGYRLELDGTPYELEATMVGVANGPAFGGGLRIADGADLHDGLLDVMVVAPMSRSRLLRLYPRLLTGSHVDDPRVSRHRVRRVSVSAGGVVAYADGERIGPLPLIVEAAPGALRVLVP